MIKPWTKTGSKPPVDFRIFSVRTDRTISPRTGAEHEVYVIETANWVNVIAVTPDQQLVMIEQYRHGSATVELEIPGGVMDARDASPEAAGVRELREETGFSGGDPRIIGKIFPNPAIMANTCFTVMVEHCEFKHPVEWDHGEDLMTRLVPIAEIPELIYTGQIRHSLVVVALYHFHILQTRPGRS